MKLSFLLSFVLMLNVSASVYSQTTRFTFTVENATMKEVFRIIEKESQFRFLYNDEFIDLDARVSLKANNSTIEDILSRLLKKAELTYQVMENNLIVITPANMALQGIAITGTVADDNGNPLPGASIAVQGTLNGAVADANGHFTITVPDENAVLIVSFVGYTTVEETVGSRRNIDVTLSEGAQDLEEVVVIGYGTVRKGDLTGSVTQVSSRDILRTNSPTLNMALQTMVPADIRSDWKPGSNPSVEIRGKTSITGSNSPLWVVDGIPMQSSSVSINPYDIVSVDILQDASATAIYGARGANGVLIITTRQAEAGEQKITASYNGWVGFDKVTRSPKLMNGKDFANFKRTAWKNAGKVAVDAKDDLIFDQVEMKSIADGTYTDWFDLVWGGESFAMNHNLTVNASGKKSGTIVSLGYLDQNSLIPYAGFKRYNLNFSNVFKFSDKLKISTKILGSYAKTDNYASAVSFAYQLSPLGTPRDENGKLKLYSNPGEVLVTNPLMETENSQATTFRYGLIGSTNLDWNIWDGLSFKLAVSADYTSTDNGSYAGSQTYSRSGKNPAASYGSSTNLATQIESFLTYEKTFGIHRIGAMVGVTEEDYFSRGISLSATDMYFDGLWYNLEAASTISAKSTSLTEWRILSYLGRLNYTLLDRYLLTVNFRRDGSSRLPDGKKWTQYPSASIAWRLSEEPFMADVKDLFLDNFKIRLSYGKAGRMAISPYSTLGRLSTTYYAWDEAGIMGTIPTVIPNKQLSWETSTEKNLGFDFNTFDGRFNGSIDLYDKETDGLIMSRNLPQTSGFGSYQQNIGKTRNKGVQIMLNGYPIRNKDFQWHVALTFYKNNNEIIDLYGDKKDDEGSNWFIGQPINVWYMYDFIGVWQEGEEAEAAKFKAKPGQPKIRDLSNPEGTDPRIAAEDRVIFSQEPKWIGSLNTTLTYKNWDLFLNLNTRQGQLAYSYAHMAGGGDPGRYNVINENYWTPENKSNESPAPWAAGMYSEFNNSDWWLKDVSFVRLANISLGYTLPQSISKKIKSTYAKVYINITNPFVWSSYRGQDPEIADEVAYPAVTSFQLGLNVNF